MKVWGIELRAGGHPEDAVSEAWSARSRAYSAEMAALSTRKAPVDIRGSITLHGSGG